MSEFVQIEKEVLVEIFDRMSYLQKVFVSVYERLRNKELGDWLTMQQLCELLHISESKARSLKRGGHIGYIRCGKESRFDVADVPALLERVEKLSGNG